MRPSGRTNDEMRLVKFEAGFSPYAEGSCLVKFGNTHVLCTATTEEKVPGFLRDSGTGWITAEYGMLPRATHLRMIRESVNGKQSGRTLEIQRLIGRCLRAITDLHSMGERQIRIDCDVIQADGGTRTAAITGSYIALHMAFKKLVDERKLSSIPLNDEIAAVSCGIYQGRPILDLDYIEDSGAQTDANFILTGRGHIVEIQATAEQVPFDEGTFNGLFALARKGTRKLIELQREVLKNF